MKKAFLFAAALCCMMTVTAQQPKNKTLSNRWFDRSFQQVQQINRNTADYHEKLDSILFGYGIKQYYYYNEDFQVEKTSLIMNYGSTIVIHCDEYTYDDNGNIIVWLETTSGVNTETHRTEYTYDSDEGMLANYIKYDYKDNEWVPKEFVNGSHSEDGTYQEMIKHCKDEDGNWVEIEKLEEFYENGNLMLQVNSDNINFEVWVEKKKAEYTYDNNNHCTSYSSYNKYFSEWIYDEAISYSYDNRGNCVHSEELDYSYVNDEWEFGGETDYQYDLTVLCSDIAGFWVIAEDNVFNTNNKLVCMEGVSANGTPYIYNFYYSEATAVDKNNESLFNLWPNPVNETLSLNAEELQQVEIYGMDGKQVMLLENGFESIDVSALSSGCYLLKATFTDGRKSTQKFVKQ